MRSPRHSAAAASRRSTASRSAPRTTRSSTCTPTTSLKFGDRQRVVLIADVFNLLNNQDPLDYDNYTELVAGTLNPNFGQPANGGISSAASFAAPRSLRLGARFEW